jgi:hypothetical protein
MGFTELGDPFVRSFLTFIILSVVTHSVDYFLVAVGWTCAEPIRYRGSTL